MYQDISQYEIITDVADLNKETTKIKLLLQKTVNKLDVEAHTVELDDGSVIEYNKVMDGWFMAKESAPEGAPDHVFCENVALMV